MTATADSARNTQAEVRELPLDNIAPSPRNARQRFDDAELAELAASIREHGLIEPIVVRTVAAEDVGRDYQIIAGERRWRASTLAGQKTILARVLTNVDDATALKLGLVENLQRVNLDVIEEAEGYRVLANELGMTQRAIAEAVNRSQPAVANAMRLLGLPEDVQELIRSGQLSRAHGIAILRFRESPAVMSRLAALAVEKSTSAHELEKGTPLAWALRNEELIVPVQWNTPFRETCRACPLSAYRKENDDYGYCIRPEHFKQLMAEHEAAQQARATDIAKAAGAVDPEALPHIRDLPYTTYERCEYAPPAGCSEACACRGRAIGPDGRIIPICTDPKQYRKLKVAETREKNREQREALDVVMAGIPDLLDAPTVAVSIGTRELAILVTLAASSHSVERDVLSDAAERWVGQPVEIPSSWGATAEDLERLERSSIRKVALAVVEAAVRGSARSRVQGWGSRGQYIELYDPTPAKTPSQPAGTPLAVVLAGTCARCNAPLLPDAIEAGDQLCANCWVESQREEADDAA